MTNVASPIVPMTPTSVRVKAGRLNRVIVRARSSGGASPRPSGRSRSPIPRAWPPRVDRDRRCCGCLRAPPVPNPAAPAAAHLGQRRQHPFELVGHTVDYFDGQYSDCGLAEQASQPWLVTGPHADRAGSTLARRRPGSSVAPLRALDIDHQRLDELGSAIVARQHLQGDSVAGPRPSGIDPDSLQCRGPGLVD